MMEAAATTGRLRRLLANSRYLEAGGLLLLLILTSISIGLILLTGRNPAQLMHCLTTSSTTFPLRLDSVEETGCANLVLPSSGLEFACCQARDQSGIRLTASGHLLLDLRDRNATDFGAWLKDCAAFACPLFPINTNS